MVLTLGFVVVFLVLIAGLVVFAASVDANPKLREIARCMMWTAMLVALWSLAEGRLLR